jgi:hypothetical protein
MKRRSDGATMLYSTKLSALLSRVQTWILTLTPARSLKEAELAGEPFVPTAKGQTMPLALVFACGAGQLPGLKMRTETRSSSATNRTRRTDLPGSVPAAV